MNSLLFEPERGWTEEAIRTTGLDVVACFLVPEKARDICARYRDQMGVEHEITISCTPGMNTSERIAEEVHRAMG